VVLDLAALGLKGDLKATDALTGERLALRGEKPLCNQPEI
jgi:hypothetical protein